MHPYYDHNEMEKEINGVIHSSSYSESPCLATFISTGNPNNTSAYSNYLK
jgi:hypothetical protein